MIKNVFSQIDSLNEQYISVWENVCNIESPSNYKEGVDKVGQYFLRMAESRGWQTEIFRQEKFGDVICVTMNPDADKRPVFISGHMDTVHPVGLFGAPAVRREGDRIYGPGTADCKGGIVAGFLAMDALREAGFVSRPITMILQSNEEVGSGLANKDSIKYMCKRAANAEAFLNLEDYEGSARNTACLARKGIAGFLFTVNGIAAHASRCAQKGASAIAEAAYKIIEIEKLKDPNGITCNCGLISGGTASNTVPNKCEFKVDLRFSNQDQYEQAVGILQTVADTTHIEGCSCDMVQTNLRPAMELNERNISLLKRINGILTNNGLPTLEIMHGKGGSDASDITLAGIPCIDSVGVEGENIHTLGEYGIISSLAESAKRIACIVCEL